MKRLFKQKILLHIVIGLVLCVCVFKGAEEIVAVKNALYDFSKSIRQSHAAAQDSPVRVPAADAWYRSTPLIYHAAGGIDGVSYTNSKEAMEATLALGSAVIEIDFAFTNDGHLVCTHEWKDMYALEPLSLEEFLDTRIYRKYTPMTAEDILCYMRSYPDLRIIVDAKGDDRIPAVKELVRLCAGDTSLIDRFVIQLYDAGAKQAVLDIYPFRNENCLFTAYDFGANRTAEILQICLTEDIPVLTIPYAAWGEETLAQFYQNGITVLEHTVNDSPAAQEAFQRGVSGIYTDFLVLDDLESPAP